MKLETRLVRTDFPNSQAIQCKIFSNDSEIGVLTSLDYNDNENCILVPIQDKLTIQIFSDGLNLGSVSFPFDLINESGCVWLPVISEGCDIITELPEELSSPKILMYFDKKTEDPSQKLDECVKAREELKILEKDYKDLLKTSKYREMALIKSLEDKESEIQDYIQQLSKAQSRIFTLLAEKKHLNDNLLRLKHELSFSTINELKEELEICRQELLKSENRNENLMQRLEDIHSEWNFIEEESKHYKETELINQVNQLKNELELKNKELSLIKSQNSQVLSEISNKPGKDELTDTMKYSKSQKIKEKKVQNSSVVVENLKDSFMGEDDSLLQHSFFANNSSKATYSNLKENLRKTPEPERCRLPKGGTMQSLSKGKFIPVPTSRRLNCSVERRGK